MKLTIILAILLMLLVGCSTVQDKVSGIQNLVLNEQDLQQLGMVRDGTDCRTEEYQTSDSAPLAQYGICNYGINSLNDTQVVIELQKFTNFEDLNGTYQYNSLHLYSIEGLISENDYGDQSRFRVNNEHDYGGQYNEPNIYYYHLWISKNKYLIHITSKGNKESEEYIAKIGRQILSKFN